MEWNIIAAGLYKQDTDYYNITSNIVNNQCVKKKS